MTAIYDTIPAQLEPEPDDGLNLNLELVDRLFDEVSRYVGASPGTELTAGTISTSTDLVKVYHHEIGKVPLLTAAEEVELAKKMEVGLFASYKQAIGEMPKAEAEAYQTIIHEGQAARQLMIAANLRLVTKVAKRYNNRGLDYLDLVGEGNLGLIKAVEKFDYTRGLKFSTYATYKIKNAIHKAVLDKARSVRLPTDLGEQLSQLDVVTRNLETELGRDPNARELAAALDITVEKVWDLWGHSRQAVSLDAGVGEDEADMLGSFVVDANEPGPDDIVAGQAEAAALRRALDDLPEDERTIVRLHYGFIDGHPAKLSDINKQRGMNVTRKRLGRILGKLGRMAYIKDLRAS